MKWRALGLGLWLLGCAGTETGNPSFDGTVGYDAHSTQSGVALRAMPGVPVVVQAAWLTLGDVQLGTETVVDVPGLGTGDHVGSQAAVTHVELPTDVHYREVSIELQSAEVPPLAAPPELAGHSILLSGTHDGRAFRIASAMRTHVSLDALPAEGIWLGEGDSGVVFGFDLGTWLKDIPWSTVSADAEGTLLIDEEHSPESLRAFEAQVVNGIWLFADRDGDGKLDADRDPVASPHE